MNTLPTLAVVDLGSNSFRLQICQNHNGQLQIIENIKQMVRLAAGLDSQKNLDQDSQQRALECLAQFGERLRGFEPEQVRAVATNTFRVAKNIAAFLPEAERALGFPIEVIAGREEARLIYAGVVHTYPAGGNKMLVVDIGGGSTEFIIGRGLSPEQTESLPLGCVTYSLRFFDGKAAAKNFQAAINAARSEIQRISKNYRRSGWDVALGTSGSAKSICNVIAEQGWGEEITLEAMRKIAEKIIDAGSVKKARLKGLKSERVEVFAGGLAVMMAVFEELEVRSMKFTEAALRDGVFYDFIGRGLEQDLREETAVRFQERYHVSKNQAARVAKIAGLFLHSLAQRAATAEVARWSEYLRWAAMLHEIGTDIAHTAYHKHGAYILAQADMPGFSRSEQELLSTLVLGQRGDLKKMTDSIGSGDAMLWNAVLALRLAVLFCRARLPLELPESTALRCGSDGSGSLKIPQSWLAHNPLTAAALAQECEQWQRAGREFVVEGI